MALWHPAGTILAPRQTAMTLLGESASLTKDLGGDLAPGPGPGATTSGAGRGMGAGIGASEGRL